MLLKASSHTQSGKHSCGKEGRSRDFKSNSLEYVPLVAIVPTRRGPAGGTPGPTRCVLLPRTPPESPSASCCCSPSPPGVTNAHQVRCHLRFKPSELTITGRKLTPSIWVLLTSIPAMSRMVGPRSMFATGICYIGRVE